MIKELEKFSIEYQKTTVSRNYFYDIIAKKKESIWLQLNNYDENRSIIKYIIF